MFRDPVGYKLYSMLQVYCKLLYVCMFIIGLLVTVFVSKTFTYRNEKLRSGSQIY